MDSFKQRVREELIDSTDALLQQNKVEEQILAARSHQIRQDAQIFMDILNRTEIEPTQGDTESNSGWVDVSECTDTEPTNATPACVQPPLGVDVTCTKFIQGNRYV